MRGVAETSDVLLDRIRALSGLPGRWSFVAPPVGGGLTGYGIVQAVTVSAAWWWLAVCGVAILALVAVAFLNPVCDWRFEHRRIATINAWHAEQGG